MHRPIHKRPRAAFTLLELIVVIVIIAILVAILIPVVSSIRSKAKAADVKQQIASLSGAIQRYYNDFQAYPGPLSNAEVAAGVSYPGITPNPDGTSSKVTMSENLVLGLLGGLYNNGGAITFDPTLVGKGPGSLNVNNPRRYSAYTEAASLSEGAYKDVAASANDTNIPEFLDRFDDPMPILYLRANVGATGIITDNGSPQAQYDLTQIIGYTASQIGVKKADWQKYKPAIAETDPLTHGLRKVTPAATWASDYPYDAYPYFTDPNNANQARQKDGFILISAGLDRVYGTEDDIVSWGSLQ